MFLSSTIAGVAGSLALFASPLPAGATPISVTSCDVSSFRGYDGQLVPATAPFATSVVRVTFVNNAPLAVKSVRFAVGYDGRSEVFTDTGTFSRGTPITHDFSPSANLRYGGPAECAVQAVTFSDGSTWQAS
jgi:hypothetical protein